MCIAIVLDSSMSPSPNFVSYSLSFHIVISLLLLPQYQSIIIILSETETFYGTHIKQETANCYELKQLRIRNIVEYNNINSVSMYAQPQRAYHSEYMYIHTYVHTYLIRNLPI
jgi:hypothetical protein